MVSEMLKAEANFKLNTRVYCRALVNKVITCILRKLGFLGKPCVGLHTISGQWPFSLRSQKSGENNNMNASIFSVSLFSFSLRKTADFEAFLVPRTLLPFSSSPDSCQLCWSISLFFLFSENKRISLKLGWINLAWLAETWHKCQYSFHSVNLLELKGYRFVKLL